MGRKGSCDKQEVNRGAWSSEEDQILMNYVRLHGEGKWRELSKRAGLKRCGKSCRLRWLNYLKPDIKRGKFSPDEDDLIIRLHNLLGNRWSLIAGRLPGRTDNEIKNYWNTYLRKKVEEKPNHNKNIPGHGNKIPIKLRVEDQSPGCPKNNSLAIIDPTIKPPHPMINPKSVRCTKVTNNIDSVNSMNFTPQDDLLIPYHEDFQYFNSYANWLEIPELFGDEAFKLDSIGEAWYENWKTDEYDYFQPEQVVDFLHFQNFGHE